MLEESIKYSRSFVKELKRFLNNRSSVVGSIKDLEKTINELKGGALEVCIDTEPAIEDVPLTSEPDEFNAALHLEVCAIVNKTQTILDHDMKMMINVDKMHSKLSSAAEALCQSNSFLGSKAQILCSLLVADTFSNIGSKAGSSLKSASAVFTKLCTGMIRTSKDQESSESFQEKIASLLLPEMTNIFDKGVATRPINDFATLFGTAADETTPSTHRCDISALVQFTSMHSKEGGKYKTAKLVGEIAQGYDKQMQEIKKFLDHLL